MEHYLYILYSQSLEQYYIGVSKDPQKRLFWHNHSHKGWTKRGRPWQLVFTKQFPDKKSALRWETWLKNQKSRSIIDSILEGSFVWNK